MPGRTRRRPRPPPSAEELVFGDVSTGAQDVLQRATDVARHMNTRYGMSEALGLATFEPPRPVFLPVPGPREYSERTAEAIDAEIQTLLEAAHGRVRATLTAKRATLEALAKRFVEAEVVDREALPAVIAACETLDPPPMAPVALRRLREEVRAPVA